MKSNKKPKSKQPLKLPKPPFMHQVTLDLPHVTFELLATLGDKPEVQDYGYPEPKRRSKQEIVRDVLEQLADHAQQGVYRPGAWERDWLCQVFSDEFLDRLEPGDPYSGGDEFDHLFQRPKGWRVTPDSKHCIVV